MKIWKRKVYNRIIEVTFLFIIIYILLCCSQIRSFAKEIDIYSKQLYDSVPTVYKLDGANATSDASASSATASTITESETEKKDTSSELTAPNATVIGAKISFISALLGAFITFLSTMYVQNMQRKSAREERKVAYEQDITNKKREVYYNYLNINKSLKNYSLKSDEDFEETEEYKQLLKKLVEASIWIEIYGSSHITDSVIEMNKFLRSETDDPTEYNMAYNSFINLIKEDLQIVSLINP